jgi:hypothetical protein
VTGIHSKPTELPGESAPPAEIVVEPTEPLPPKVPPPFTKTDDVIEPFTLNVPPLTNVGPL